MRHSDSITSIDSAKSAGSSTASSTHPVQHNEDRHSKRIMWEDQKNSYKKFSLDLNLDLDSDLDLEKITLDEQNKDEKENLSDSIRVCQICHKINIQKLPLRF